MRHVEPSHLLTRLLLVTLAVTLLGSAPAAETARVAEARLQADLDVVRAFRPAYPFWQHIFTIPDGRIAFGSARDGRLLATFPSKGDWATGAVWLQQDLGTALADVKWPVRVDDRRDLVTARLEPALGPLVHNPTRGAFLLPNIPKIRPVPWRMGRHLRALRRPGGHRPRPGGSRVRAERHGPVAGQRPGAVPMAAAELAGPGSPLAGEDRGV